jgi:transposase
MTWKNCRSLVTKKQQKERLLACRRVLKFGTKQEKVAADLGVSRQTLSKWVNAYRKGGSRILQKKKKGRPTGITLTKFDAAKINRLILDNTPDQLGLPFHLWNKNALLKLADQRYGRSLSRSTLKRYLEIWKYLPVDPSPRRFCRDMKFDLGILESEGKLPIEKYYKNVSLQAKREGARVYWCNITPLRHDYPITPDYDAAGKPQSKSSLGRKIEYFSISAITGRGSVHFMIFRQKITPPIFMEFMQRLIKENRRKVFVFMIEHRVQRFRSVKEWFEEASSLIRLFPFPALI